MRSTEIKMVKAGICNREVEGNMGVVYILE
jgi:hypothetical protein